MRELKIVTPQMRADALEARAEIIDLLKRVTFLEVVANAAIAELQKCGSVEAVRKAEEWVRSYRQWPRGPVLVVNNERAS